MFLRFSLFFAVVLPVVLFAQDSLKTNRLEDVIVSAARYERLMGSLPVPVLLVPKAQIRLMGSLRLGDVLSEQTGLALVPDKSGTGSGLQLHGFNPAYTLILLDGEPLIGRFQGGLSLDRYTVRNIRQIEIVKGPSSSLYGSDALAGVVNIITENPASNQYNSSLRYGTNNTADFNADLSLAGKKTKAYLYMNRLSSDGYDLTPESYGKTVSPFANYTFHAKLNGKVCKNTDFTVSGRFFTSNSQLAYSVSSANQPAETSGHGTSKEWNFNPSLTHRVSARTKIILRYYFTKYAADSKLFFRDGTPVYSDSFSQTYSRPETAIEYFANAKNILTFGTGFIRESVKTTRYGDDNDRFQYTFYGYAQHEWHPHRRWTVISGGRWDKNTVYGSQASPKLSARWEANDRLSFKASAGVGFKTPDFRQLYFNFTNQAAGGYSVFGTEVVGEKLDELRQQGNLGSYLYDPSKIGKLKAESSVAFHAGVKYFIKPNFPMEIGLFDNEVRNLIETQAVAAAKQNQIIYSYRNMSRVSIRGLELNSSFHLNQNFTFTGGYQLLYAWDQNVMKDIREGKVYGRDPETGISYQLRGHEYFGLYNRSRPMANLKVQYHIPKYDADVFFRILCRSKFALGDVSGNIQGGSIPSADRNNNSILDKYDSFIQGFPLLNFSVSKSFKKAGIQAQAGAENLLDRKEPLYLPGMPGRILFLTFNYSLKFK